MVFDELWRLERQLAGTWRSHRRNMELLKQKKAGAKEMALAMHEATLESDTLVDTIESIKSSRLLGRANRLSLPTAHFKADEDETWVCGYTGGRYLSRTAQSDLRSRIRQEEKERREAWAFWVKDIFVPAFSVLIGILGATAGLVALLRK
jgi:hypothetical protein